MATGQGIAIPAGAPPVLAEALAGVERYIAELLRQPVYLPPYTVAELALLDPARWVNCAVNCTDESGGTTAAISDGVTWNRVSDGAPVS